MFYIMCYKFSSAVKIQVFPPRITSFRTMPIAYTYVDLKYYNSLFFFNIPIGDRDVADITGHATRVSLVSRKQSGCAGGRIAVRHS